MSEMKEKMICQDLIQLPFGQILFGLERLYEGMVQRKPFCCIKLTGCPMSMFKGATLILRLNCHFAHSHSMGRYWPCVEMPVVPLPALLAQCLCLPEQNLVVSSAICFCLYAHLSVC